MLHEQILGNNQIPMVLKEVEKTIYTCPDGIFAFMRMFFWVFAMNPLAISNMVERFIEMFMDNFLVVGALF